MLKKKKRLNRFRNVEIQSGDIFLNFPYEGTVFYLFNPFGQEMTKRFIDELLKCGNERNDIRIFYFYPTCGALFKANEKFKCREYDVNGTGKNNALFIELVK